MTDAATGRRRCRLRRSAIVAVLTLILAMFLIAIAPAASAHNGLVSSDPSADSVVAEPPKSIELVFDQDVKDFQPKIAITITGHDPVEVTPAVNGPTVTADLSTVDLPGRTVGNEPVSWRIGYRVVSADGHPVTGLLNFSVGSGPAPTLGNAAGAAAAEGSGPTENDNAATGDGPSSGSNTGWWIVVGLLAVGVVAVLAVRTFARRRSNPADAARQGAEPFRPL